jgi:hypothetical protein
MLGTKVTQVISSEASTATVQALTNELAPRTRQALAQWRHEALDELERCDPIGLAGVWPWGRWWPAIRPSSCGTTAGPTHSSDGGRARVTAGYSRGTLGLLHRVSAL